MSSQVASVLCIVCILALNMKASPSFLRIVHKMERVRFEVNYACIERCTINNYIFITVNIG